MRFALDPSPQIKIDRMKQRVRWQYPDFLRHGIDQTRLVLDTEQIKQTTHEKFSFLVLGDSGTGTHRGGNPQRRVATWLMENSDGCHFVLHTGDLVYLVGSQDQYFDNFIEPYREWLVGGDTPRQIAYDQMIFRLPFLPVPGNHDYYDVPLIYSAFSRLVSPFKSLLQRQIDLDYNWRGSFQGDVYARAFLDYLKDCNPAQLDVHLKQHYTAKTDTGRCLQYQTGKFTRLPNRYYTFCQEGVDFFALDSNTFNVPVSLSQKSASNTERQQLITQQQQLLNQKQEQLAKLSLPVNDDGFNEIYVKVEQIDEQLRDLEMQLTQHGSTIDFEQLDWLRQRLIHSWNTPNVRGRVIYFHHPPYVTEATKWYQAQTLAVRQHLRQVFDDVQQILGDQRGDRPVVDLVLNGHAHCFEYLQTLDTGHADAHTHYLICGGSGFSLRRQRSEGDVLLENFADQQRPVARSHQFVGRHGYGNEKRHPYSALRIDVESGMPLKFTVSPYVVEHHRGHWQQRVLPSISIIPSLNKKVL